MNIIWHALEYCQHKCANTRSHYIIYNDNKMLIIDLILLNIIKC